MKKIICFDTSVASTNLGDYIIMQSCLKQMAFVFENNFVLRFPTHTPIGHFYQDSKRTSGGRYDGDSDYKFVCGTNLLNDNMVQPTPTWNINPFNCKMAEGSICIGVGMGSSTTSPNLYTKCLLKKVLSNKYIHSTRDERTAGFLRSIGLKAINTGCATTWGLTNDFCESISRMKSDNVITTLTDYKRDPYNDKVMLNILISNYKRVYFWVQGIDDYDYIRSLGFLDKVIIVSPTLESYENALQMDDLEYVGTRLHAGIKAMQCKKRSIIIGVDNRAKDMRKDISLNVLSRNQIKDELEQLIYRPFVTRLSIKIDNIRKWKSQFYED